MVGNVLRFAWLLYHLGIHLIVFGAYITTIAKFFPNIIEIGKLHTNNDLSITDNVAVTCWLRIVRNGQVDSQETPSVKGGIDEMDVKRKRGCDG